MLSSQEFEEFTRFALGVIESGKADSLRQLVQQWEAQRELNETLQSIQPGLDDVQARRVTPADEAFAEIRRELKLKQ